MKRVLFCVVLFALLLGLVGCAHEAKTAADMEAEEFLRQVAKPARRLKSETGVWYYLRDDGKVQRLIPMEDIQQNRVEDDVVFELTKLETVEENEVGQVYLHYTVHNGMENPLIPFGKVETAVLLKDGWYVMPHVPTEDFGDKLESGGSREGVLNIATIEETYLPDGRYRIQLKIDDLSYAYLEFKVENLNGAIHITA